jgi:hypothetical protein
MISSLNLDKYFLPELLIKAKWDLFNSKIKIQSVNALKYLFLIEAIKSKTSFFERRINSSFLVLEKSRKWIVKYKYLFEKFP